MGWFGFIRCIAAKGEGAPECDKFAKYYRSLCPGEWVRTFGAFNCPEIILWTSLSPILSWKMLSNQIRTFVSFFFLIILFFFHRLTPFFPVKIEDLLLHLFLNADRQME